MIKRILPFIILLCANNYVLAQSNPQQDSIKKKLDATKHYLSDGSNASNSPGTLFKEIDMSSYELLAGNLTFTDKDQAQKLVISPFKLLNNPKKMGQLVNTKLNLALKDKITTIGIGLAFDNSTYFSKRADRIRKRIFCDTCIKPAPIPGPVNLNYDLFIQDLLTRLQDRISTVGITDTNLLNAIRSANQDTINIMLELYHTQQLQAVSDQYKKDSLADGNKQFEKLLLAYDKAMAENVFKGTIGYNFQLFSNLFSQGAVNGFDSLNYHNLKSHNITGSITYSHHNNNWVFVLGYNQIYAYTSAEKGQKKVPYYGPTFSASKRLFKFVKQAALDTMAAYKKSLFVPSLNLGCSFEGKYADGSAIYNSYYENKAKQVISWMPFVDLLFTTALQFRIGIPITRMRYPSGEKQSFVGANIQYSIKLSNLAL